MFHWNDGPMAAGLIGGQVNNCDRPWPEVGGQDPASPRSRCAGTIRPRRCRFARTAGRGGAFRAADVRAAFQELRGYAHHGLNRHRRNGPLAQSGTANRQAACPAGCRSHSGSRATRFQTAGSWPWFAKVWPAPGRRPIRWRRPASSRACTIFRNVRLQLHVLLGQGDLFLGLPTICT